MRVWSAVMVALAANLCVSFSAPQAAAVTRMERALLKLDPEERAHQVCAAKGLEVVKGDKRLARVDRVMPDTFQRAKIVEGVLKAKGAAVRANSHWYKLTFDCTLSDDQLKVTAFTYEVGKEIPPEEWDEIGLWR